MNTMDGYYVEDGIIKMDAVIGDTTYTNIVSTEANFNIHEVYAIGSFMNTTLRDIVDDVAEISYKDGYDDGYEDGYSDGYVDGFKEGVASVSN